MSEALLNIDWDLLYEQKLVLLEMLKNTPSESTEGQALYGVVHLLDALQDEAVEEGRWEYPEPDSDHV